MTNAPTAPPLLGALLGGFFILVAGLAVLAVGSRRVTMGSPRSTYRAVAYALSTAAFTRVLQGALLGHERSPWLLALGDVIFIALSLFVWVMVLAEGYPLSAFGLRRMPAGRLLLTLLMGIGAVAVYSYGP